MRRIIATSKYNAFRPSRVLHCLARSASSYLCETSEITPVHHSISPPPVNNVQTTHLALACVQVASSIASCPISAKPPNSRQITAQWPPWEILMRLCCWSFNTSRTFNIVPRTSSEPNLGTSVKWPDSHIKKENLREGLVVGVIPTAVAIIKGRYEIYLVAHMVRYTVRSEGSWPDELWNNSTSPDIDNGIIVGSDRSRSIHMVAPASSRYIENSQERG